MKWFGRKSAGRDVSRPALARGVGFAWGGEEAGYWPRSYEARVRSAVMDNPVALRAVRMVAEGAQSAAIYGEGPDGAAMAGLIGGATGDGLIEAVAAQLLLHGNAFVRVALGGAGEMPVALYPLRPERVTVIADAAGWPMAYEYRVGQTIERIAAVDEFGRVGVIHIRQFHPMDDHYGLGCLEAAAGSVAIHNAAQKWNKALLDNAARPSGALVFDPGEPGAALSPDQFERLKAEIEAGFQGAANAGRPMLLEGGLKWQAMSMSPADMDFAGLKAGAARDIALAFGVPSMLMGLPGDATYANYREANRALWRLTILPLLSKITGTIERGLKGYWPEGRLLVDTDMIPALSEDRERLWAQVTAADFLTDREKREMLGFAAQVAEGGRG
ncbi:phage portal protein [Aquisediminimonas sediminicola]|uniref:phage portal protein n=1 Tax=Alteraquisediminimonas sediminicola TaxID=2676787 RepID=UPI001C8E2FD8|nr:phage portal protein [Aquisediminimonas sediminicola]